MTLAMAGAAACAAMQDLAAAQALPTAAVRRDAAVDAVPANTATHRSSARRYAFAIPRMPLRAALEHYHAVTGLSLLYDDAIAQGRTAGPLHGDYTAEAALHGLLAGTGVTARYTSASAFMLVGEQGPAEQEAGPARGSTSGPLAAARRQAYYGRVQAQVVAALCGDAATIPGGYRLAANVWIKQGAIADLVLHPTGDPARDERIRRRLLGLALPALPPADVAQPVTLLVLPREPAQTGDCAARREEPA